MANLELITQQPVEIIRSDNQEYFSGYAAKWYDGTVGTEYRIMPNVVERIQRNAFDDILAKQPEVEALYNHNTDNPLGSTTTGTLHLETDNIGLKYLIPFDPSDIEHQRVRSKLGKGYIKGSSFHADGYWAPMKKESGKYVKEIAKVTHLHEISLVRSAAYKSCEAIIRSEIDTWEKGQRLLAYIKALR